MADGSVKIDVGLDITKAERDLAKLKDKINKAEDALNADSAKKNSLTAQIEAANNKIKEAWENAKALNKELKQQSIAADAKLDASNIQLAELREAYRNARGDEKNSLRVQLAEAVEENRVLRSEANRLAKEYDKSSAALKNIPVEVRQATKEAQRLTEEQASLNTRIDRSTQSLTEMREQAGAMAREIESARPGEALARGFEYAKKKLWTFLKYAVGIRSVYILFRRLRSAIKDAVSSFAEHDAETKGTIDALKSSLEQLKMSWGAAFAPILNAVAPLLQKLIGWLTDAANAVSRFVAILSGKSTYKRVVANTEAVAGGMEDVSQATDEAKKSVMGFDELNILNGKTGGANAGASGAGTSGKYSVIEEAVNAFDGSLVSNLALSVNDVFFDWSDITPEQIAEKALAGLLGLGGAIIGGMIGGVPGALIGLFAGLALGVLLDSTIFNHDGELSRDELIKTLIDAAGFVVGAAIGFMAGGPLGAMIGATVGLYLAVNLSKTLFKPDGTLDKDALFAEVMKAVNRFIKVTAYGPVYALVFDVAAMFKIDIKKSIFENIIQPAKEALGIHSPSTVSYDIAQQTGQGFLNGLRDKFSDIKTMIKGKLDEMKQLFNVTWSFPKIKMPHFSWTWQQIGKYVSIPKISVDWYARGGVFDDPTMIGVGEAGKEAVVPLEKNTEWMRLVADGLMDRLEQAGFAQRMASAFASVPMPAMAGGSVVPPRISGGFSDYGIEDAVRRGVSDAFNIAMNAGQYEEVQPINVYIGGEKIDSYLAKRERRKNLISGGR